MTKQDKTDKEERNRILASASFVGVIIIIGLPLWWKTTTVYRVDIPYNAISVLDVNTQSILTKLYVIANDEPTAVHLASHIDSAFKRFSSIIRLDIVSKVIPNDLKQTLDSVVDNLEAVEEVKKFYNLNDYNTFFVMQRSPLTSAVWIGNERLAFFRDIKESGSIVRLLLSYIYEPEVLIAARGQTKDQSRMDRFPSGPGFNVVLSIVHPRPQEMTVEFNAREAMDKYLKTFFVGLSDLHNFTVKSQWIHLLDFDFKPHVVLNEKDKHYSVPENHVIQMLSSLESRTATHVSELPTINLVVYEPPCEISPLVIAGDKKSPAAHAFITTMWGGVVVDSPSEEDCKEGLHKIQPKFVMGLFRWCLDVLIGITQKPNIKDIVVSPMKNGEPQKWELDGLMRMRTFDQLANAQRNLKSLASLLRSIANIVINDEVGEAINRAVDNIGRSEDFLRCGELVPAHRYSQWAFLEANRAFMHKTLLALLYFPDDQKYAIYIPLFLPVMFPVILSLRKLFLWCRGKPSEKVKIH